MIGCNCAYPTSEATELLLASGLDSLTLDLQNVEAHSLGERTAFTDGDNISLLNTETGRQVSRDVLVALLETVVLLNVVQVVTSDLCIGSQLVTDSKRIGDGDREKAYNDSALHLGGFHDSAKNTATDRDIACERALLVDVVALDRLLRRLEAETDILEVPSAGLALLLL